MKKVGKVKKIVTSAIIAGLAAGIPVAGTLPSSVFAAETDSINIFLDYSDIGEIISDTNSASLGDTINLEAVPVEGYRFGYWIIDEINPDSTYEKVSGDIFDRKISIKITSSDDYREFGVKAVFIPADEYIVNDRAAYPYKIYSAKAGEVVDVSGYIGNWDSRYEEDGYEVSISGGRGVSIYKIDGDVDITSDVMGQAGDEGAFVMPAADICVLPVAKSAYTKHKVLDGGFEMYEMDDETDTPAVLGASRSYDPETGEFYETFPGDETDAPAVADPAHSYDPETGEAEEVPSEDESEKDAKVLSEVELIEDGGKEDGNTSEIDNSEQEDSEKNSDDLKKADGNGGGIVENNVSDIKTGSVSTPSTIVSRPYTARYEGSNTVGSNTVTAPPTGDYNITTAITVAAIAAGAGIVVAAAVILKRRTMD